MSNERGRDESRLIEAPLRSSDLPTCSFSYNSEFAGSLRIDVDNYSVPVRAFEDDESLLYVVGSPILGESISPSAVWCATNSDGVPAEFISKINGEFLLVHLGKKSGVVRVTNDRFSSIPFYYVEENGGIFGSVFYKDVWRRLAGNGTLKLNPSKFFEFLWLQGVMGERSYDTESRLLPSATTMTVQPETGDARAKLSLNRYWVPSLRKVELSIDDAGEELARLYRQLIRRKTSDNPSNVGLFLSGGIDSWTVLSAFDSNPTCYTVGVSENNEVRVARQAAAIAGANHHFIPLKPDPYSSNIDEMIQIGGGMHAFDHGIYYGLKDQISPPADVLFHGQFLDFWFQGSGLLTTNRKLLGWRTSFKQIEPFSDDLVDDYLSKISYRLKGISPLEYVVKSKRDEMMFNLRGSVDEVRQQGEGFCLTPFDEWEHLQFYNMSRRYSYSNLSCIGTAAEQRNPAFDNDLFNFYTSLPRSHRLNGKIAMKTLGILNSELAALPTANTNERPNRGPMGRDFDRIRRKLRLKRSKQFNITPEERTFPDRGRMFAQQPELRSMAQDLCDSDELASLGFLDMDRIARDIPNWLENPQKDAGAFVTFLVTIDRFLKMGPSI